ncbi:FMN-binding protein [Streptomyces sp. NPDC127092]|uniref:FMN-binding protein n=1 Tax=Streptomyces sp. NPDC127092 TaxID=3347135 RepID=UPI00365D3B89
MRKTHPLRRAVLAGAGTVSAVVLLLALKPTTDPSLAQDAAGPNTPVASADSAGAGAASPASAAPSDPGSPTASPSAGTRGTATASASGSASPSASTSASRTTTAPTRTSAPTASRTTSGTSGTSGGSTTRTVAGATVSTQYGSVQVQITVRGSTITGVTALKSPSSTPRSREISADAVPQLNQRTLAAQSADIDSVSGATYTSAGYRQSLQSALDRAGV